MHVVEAIILAIIEGITEFLPISSTGHMIVASSVMGIATDPFTKTFIVAIQLGAIFSVVFLYWKKFFQSFGFYLKLSVGFIPAAILGFIFNEYIDQMLERVEVVAIMLIVGGVFFLFMDSLFKEPENASERPINYSTAFTIGVFQTIALVPGVSRSAATIIGGLTQKLTKKTAAEFSFFLAIPTMAAATGYKLLKFYEAGGGFKQNEVLLLIVGNIVAFIVALQAIKSFIGFFIKNGFKVFGYYRILLGGIILILYFSGVKLFIV